MSLSHQGQCYRAIARGVLDLVVEARTHHHSEGWRCSLVVSAGDRVPVFQDKACYELNVCVPHKIRILKPNPQCDRIWRWSLGGG